MSSERTHRGLLHGAEIAYSVIIGAWYALPHIGKAPWLSKVLSARLPAWVTEGVIDLPGLPFAVGSPGRAGLLLTVATGFMVYSLPLILLMKLASPFASRKAPGLFDPRRALPICLDIISSVFMLVSLALHVLRFAGNMGYFEGLSPLVYGFAGLSLVFNVLFMVLLIRTIRNRNSVFREYQAFLRKIRAGKAGFMTAVLSSSIRKRLVLSFMSIVVLVISVLGYTLLADFRRTILETLIYNGKSLAERSASVVKANLGDYIALGDYFEIERKKNLDSEFRFASLSYFQKEGKSDRFLAALSTDDSILGKKLSLAYTETAETSVYFNREQRVYEFVSPIRFGSEAKLVGFSVAGYDRDVIYEPYFRTQMKVILISAAFIYVAILLVYLLGGNIVLPILFLRMSVNRISSAISDMVTGRVRVSAALLNYQDLVKTKDEIKTLSTEIGRMTSVIRGVVPYISTSTLKHSERVVLVSEKRELAFLFTDIRGFTSLCEGLTPEEVVSIVNGYLDLQTTIILDCGGDIDKFVGDAIMAMFEGGDKELKACRAAMEIRKAMAEADEERRAKKQKTITIGIGINTGPVVFGSVGARDRMDFTSIGDTVNLAARLEGANKEYGTKTLIGEDVYTKVKEQFVCRQIDALTVKGKQKPLRVYEILQDVVSASKTVRELKKHFERGLSHYRKQRWDEAQKAFRHLNDKYDDRTSAIFLDRISFFKRNPPPAKWNGVFSLQVK